MLLRVNQETGPPIVLFRRGFARFDSATLQRFNALYVTD
jgi:hypothetical protein